MSKGWGWRGATPCWKKNYDPPSSLQNHPHPLRNGFWPPTPDFEFFKLATFFFLEKNSGRKKIFAGSSFCLKRPKSAIKFLLLTPLQPHPKKKFMTPLAKKFMTPYSSKELAHLCSGSSIFNSCLVALVGSSFLGTSMSLKGTLSWMKRSDYVYLKERRKLVP